MKCENVLYGSMFKNVVKVLLIRTGKLHFYHQLTSLSFSGHNRKLQQRSGSVSYLLFSPQPCQNCVPLKSYHQTLHTYKMYGRKFQLNNGTKMMKQA